MLEDGTGKFVTARRDTTMVLVKPHFEEEYLCLNAPGMETIKVSLHLDTKEFKKIRSEYHTTHFVEGVIWCKLFWMSEKEKRICSETEKQKSERHVSSAVMLFEPYSIFIWVPDCSSYTIR